MKGIADGSAQRQCALAQSPGSVVIGDLDGHQPGVIVQSNARRRRISLDFVTNGLLDIRRQLAVLKHGAHLHQAHALALAKAVAALPAAVQLRHARLLDLAPDLAAPGHGRVAADDERQDVLALDAVVHRLQRDNGALELAAELALPRRDAHGADGPAGGFQPGREYARDEFGCRDEVDSQELLRESGLVRECLEGLDLFLTGNERHIGGKSVFCMSLMNG